MNKTQDLFDGLKNYITHLRVAGFGLTGIAFIVLLVELGKDDWEKWEGGFIRNMAIFLGLAIICWILETIAIHRRRHDEIIAAIKEPKTGKEGQHNE